VGRDNPVERAASASEISRRAVLAVQFVAAMGRGHRNLISSPIFFLL